MPTISGLRRRGVTPQALRDFAYNIGITKYNAPDGCRRAGALHPRGSQPARPPPPGGAAPAQSRHHELPEGQVEASRCGQQSRRPRAPARARSRSAASCTSSRTISWRRPRRSTSGCVPAAKCGSSTPTSSSATKSSRTAAGKVVELRCTADLDSKTGGATAEPQGQRDHSLGQRGARGRRGGAALRPAVHRGRARCRRRFQEAPQPALLGGVTAKCEPSLNGRRARPALPIRAARLLRRRPGFHPRQARV